jgi:hypothetical protein
MLVPMLSAGRLLTAHEAARLVAFAARAAARDGAIAARAANSPAMTATGGA